MEWLSDMEDTPIERKSLLPSSKFFFPNSIEKKNAVENAEDEAGNSDTIILSDSDADGLGAVLAVKQARENVGFIGCGPSSKRLDISDAIDIILEEATPGVTVFIADICPDDADKIVKLGQLSRFSSDVFWFDHHDWDESMENFVENHVDFLDVDTGDHTDDTKSVERCGAELVYRYFVENENFDFSENVTEAVRVTGIYDCWKKQTDENGNQKEEFIDNRAKDLSDACSVLSHSEYLDALEKYGADILQDEDISKKVEEYREEQQSLEDLAVERAEIENINGILVAFIYGRGPTNSIADKLKSLNDVSLVAHVKPSGGVSFRGSDEFEKCSELASEHGGGGHGRAAGCFIAPKSDGDYDRWDTDMLDYSEHWRTHGEKTRNAVRETIKQVA